MTTPHVSIIIVTRNRLPTLKESVAVLMDELGPRVADTEVLIVDTSDEAPAPGEIDVRTSHHYLGNIPYSMVQSRNYGVQVSTGEVLVFIDDDCYVQADWFERILTPFGDEAVGVVGGRVISDPWAPAKESLEIGVMDLKHDRIVGNFDRVCRGAIEVEHLPGGNFAVRRNLAVKVGGFDPGFIGSANHEETDFIHRVRQMGVLVLFVPQAVVEHRAAPRSDGIARTMTNFVYRYSMVRNRLYFHKKHGTARSLMRSTGRHLTDAAAGLAQQLAGTFVFASATFTGIVAGLASRAPQPMPGSLAQHRMPEPTSLRDQPVDRHR